MGSGHTDHEFQHLWYQGKQEMERLSGQSQVFASEKDAVVDHAMQTLPNAGIRTIGPELIFGKLYEHISFGRIDKDLFRHLVIGRLSFPLSKLKTVDYLYSCLLYTSDAADD